MVTMTSGTSGDSSRLSNLSQLCSEGVGRANPERRRVHINHRSTRTPRTSELVQIATDYSDVVCLSPTPTFTVTSVSVSTCSLSYDLASPRNHIP